MRFFAYLFLLTVFSSYSAPAETRPNILLITVDNLGYGDLKCYNPESTTQTPNFDRLASRGARLTAFYTASPTCTVSRACLLTGRIPQRHGLDYQLPGVKGNYGIGLSQNEILIPQLLKTAPSSYATGCFGKWNIGFARGSRPTERGFDEYIGNASGNMDYYRHNYNERHDLYSGIRELHREGDYATDILAEAAIEFMERRSKETAPWFCYLPFNAPHFPSPGNRREGEPNIWQAPDWAFEETGLSPAESDPKKRYNAVVYALDKRIGEVLDALEITGKAEQTFVFLMSDNGAFRLNRKGIDVGINTPLRSGGVTCWEGGIRVPAMVRWPGKIGAGSVIDEPLWSPDIMIACAKLAGVQLPRGLVLDGKDPLPVLTQGAPSPHDSLFFRYRKHEALRKGKWKIVRENPARPFQLYDLGSDQSESSNRADQHPGIVKELESTFSEWETSFANRFPKIKALRNSSFVRENRGGWRTVENGLELRTQPDRIWAGDGAENILTVPLMTAEPRMLSARVALQNPSIKYEQAGLVCYVDDNHFLKFIVEHIDGEAWVVSGMESPGNKRSLLSKSRLAQLSADLAMEVHGDVVLCRYREDESGPWQFACSKIIPTGPNRSIGLFTQDGPAQKSNWARFTDLTIGGAALLDPDFGIQKVAGGAKFTEGPALSPEGNLYFSDGPNDRIMKLDRSGRTTTFLHPCGAANGLLFDQKGNLLMCQSSREGGGRAVARMALSDPRPTILTREYKGARYIAPNDLAIGRKGEIYFTDPFYGGEKSQPTAGVYRINPDRSVELLIGNLLKPNGILVSADGETLYVSDRGTQKLHQYQIKPDGSIVDDGVLYDFSTDRGIDGMWLDELGNIYGAAGKGNTTGLFVISPHGHLLLHEPMPEFSTNVVIGGEEGRDLFLTATSSVYKMKTRFRSAKLPPNIP